MDITQKSSVRKADGTFESVILQSLWIAGYAVVTALGAQLEIPHYPVPFTTQTFFVLCAGIFLGARNGALAMAFYLVLGLLGLPAFAGGAFGIAKLLGPTGGYLFAFPISAFVVGYLIRLRKEYWWMLLTMTVGLFIVFSFGTLQLNFVYFHHWKSAIASGFLIFSWWDAVKLIAATSIAYYYFNKVK
ncbi:MAG TPA: biotin transporter BioY [Bacteroidota bacterium]|nr:biotin transporter BioY [Bacteroidota bacterium]